MVVINCPHCNHAIKRRATTPHALCAYCKKGFKIESELNGANTNETLGDTPDAAILLGSN